MYWNNSSLDFVTGQNDWNIIVPGFDSTKCCNVGCTLWLIAFFHVAIKLFSTFCRSAAYVVSQWCKVLDSFSKNLYSFVNQMV